jgi:hypothetical protein
MQIPVPFQNIAHNGCWYNKDGYVYENQIVFHLDDEYFYDNDNKNISGGG